MHAFGGVEVLDAERQALQRRRVAAGEPRIARLRHRKRALGCNGDEGVEAFRLVDGVEIGAGQFNAGERFRAQRLARLRQREVGRIGQGDVLFHDFGH